MKRNKTKKPTAPIVPSMGQFWAIIQSIRENKDNPNAAENAGFVEFMGSFGLGNAEIESLTWGVIDYDLQVLPLTRIKIARPMDVPIYPWCVNLLNRLGGQMSMKRVAQNLYRDERTGHYWGKVTVKGRTLRKNLGTAIRQNADVALKAWLSAIKLNGGR